MLRKPYWTTAGLVLAALLIFFVIRFTAANRHLDPAMAPSAAASPELTTPSAPQKSTPPVRISAAQLYAEYDMNAVAANDEFAGRTLEVSGRILSVGQDSDGNIQLRIGVDQYGFNDVQAQVMQSTGATLSQLRKGHSVTLVCTNVHRALGSVTLDRCSIAPVD